MWRFTCVRRRQDRITSPSVATLRRRGIDFNYALGRLLLVSPDLISMCVPAARNLLRTCPFRHVPSLLLHRLLLFSHCSRPLVRSLRRRSYVRKGELLLTNARIAKLVQFHRLERYFCAAGGSYRNTKK